MEELPTDDNPPKKFYSWVFMRGESFASNLDKIHESKKTLDMLQRFRARNLVIEKTHVSYRTLSHWDSLNLIESERETSQGWRQFNLVETLWLSVIKQCRELGLSLEQIAKAKPSFFAYICPQSLFSFIDYYLIGAILMKLPVFFIILPSGHAEFLSYGELNMNVSMGIIQSHVSIFLNPLLNQTLRQQIPWEFPIERSVSLEQAELIDLINTEDFDHLKILKKKNELSEVKIVKNFPASIKEHELRSEHDNVSIENQYRKGYATGRKRTIHAKLNNQDDETF